MKKADETKMYEVYNALTKIDEGSPTWNADKSDFVFLAVDENLQMSNLVKRLKNRIGENYLEYLKLESQIPEGELKIYVKMEPAGWYGKITVMLSLDGINPYKESDSYQELILAE